MKKTVLILPLIAVIISFVLGQLCPLRAADARDLRDSEIVLHFDEAEERIVQYHFKTEDEERPSPGPFVIVNYTPMSNARGERWALITVQNRAVGGRFLKNDLIMATFADGTKAEAKNLNDRIDGGALHSQAVYFGRSRFPIVAVEMNYAKNSGGQALLLDKK